jgi:hypothetical protein
MPQGRPDIPIPLQRDVLVEAGHRCAIPTCRSHPVEIAHIVPWAKVRRHEMVNLIALCPTCHTRYDRGEIDRKAMQRYKQKLSVINGLYSSLERRILEHFAILRDIKIKLAFPLHVRQQVGEEDFNRMVRDDFGDQADSMFSAIEFAISRDDDLITLPSGHRLMLSQLIRDGYLTNVADSVTYVEGIPILEIFQLTDAGKDFLDSWVTADNLNPDDFSHNCDCNVGKSFAHHLREHVPREGFDAVARGLRAL